MNFSIDENLIVNTLRTCPLEVAVFQPVTGRTLLLSEDAAELVFWFSDGGAINGVAINDNRIQRIVEDPATNPVIRQLIEERVLIATHG